jgi:hypothetical protein
VSTPGEGPPPSTPPVDVDGVERDRVEAAGIEVDGVEGPLEEGLVDALGELRGSEARLEAVESALGRLDAGRYFTCVRCGQPLERTALEAHPLHDRCPEPCAAR